MDEGTTSSSQSYYTDEEGDHTFYSDDDVNSYNSSDESLPSRSSYSAEHVDRHTYLQEKYPGLVMPMTLHKLQTLEKAQEILMGVPYEDSGRWPDGEDGSGRVRHFCCDGRRINDDIAIMDNLYSMTICGPSLTLPATIVPKYIPTLRVLEFRNIANPEQGKGMEEFSAPKDIVEQLNIQTLRVHNATPNIIHQFYPLQKLRRLVVGSPLSDDQTGSSSSFEGLIKIFRLDMFDDDGTSTSSTRSDTAPFSRNMRSLIVDVTSQFTVDQFCDFVLLFTPDKYPTLQSLYIRGSNTVSAAHIDALARRLNNLIDDNRNYKHTPAYQPPKLIEFKFAPGSKCFLNIAGLRSIISLLNVLDTVHKMNFPMDRNYPGKVNQEDDERGNPEYNKLLRQIMFRFNYTGSKFGAVVPISSRSISKSSQHRKEEDVDDLRRKGEEVGCSNLKLSLWPRLMYRAGQYKPLFLLKGNGCTSIYDLRFLKPATAKDVSESHASTIFVLLRNGLAGNVDWHDRCHCAVLQN